MSMRDDRTHAGLIQSIARILLLPGWAVAIGLMLKGYGDVGDGFSAGVIAALAILLQGLAFGADELDRIAVARFAGWMAYVGLAIALLVAFVPVLRGDPVFLHWPRSGDHVVHFGTIEFITPVLFDIGVFLVVYGFCVGSVHAIAREEARKRRAAERQARRKATP